MKIDSNNFRQLNDGYEERSKLIKSLKRVLYGERGYERFSERALGA